MAAILKSKLVHRKQIHSAHVAGCDFSKPCSTGYASSARKGQQDLITVSHAYQQMYRHVLPLTWTTMLHQLPSVQIPGCNTTCCLRAMQCKAEGIPVVQELQ